jgi:ribonuclease HI
VESENPDSLEWRSVVNAVVSVDLRSSLSSLEPAGVIAYTDGACLKNPGGPAGWSALFWAAASAVDGQIVTDAPRVECYGHIPAAVTTTNNRAEIAAVLAVLSLAPPALPLTIYSDSEYTINVATGRFKMKANPELWTVYRKLAGYRKQPPEFIWVQGHAGHLHNERADELAGLGAWNNNRKGYEQWQAAQSPEARNGPPPAQMTALRQQVQQLKAYFDSVAIESGRINSQERQFIEDMAKRLQKNRFVPSEKQANWINKLISKYRIH